MTRTVEFARKLLPVPVEASITLIVSNRPTTPASTASVATELDAAQYALGSGPCMAAAEAGQPVLIPDMRVESRWPEFGAAAVAQGVATSLSVPLPVERLGMAALNLYGVHPPPVFTPAVCELAQALGGYAAEAITTTTLFISEAQLADQMREAMASRESIEQAKGILMGQRHCDAEAAFAILVQLSQATQRKLREVAATLVEHTITG